MNRKTGRAFNGPRRPAAAWRRRMPVLVSAGLHALLLGALGWRALPGQMGQPHAALLASWQTRQNPEPLEQIPVSITQADGGSSGAPPLATQAATPPLEAPPIEVPDAAMDFRPVDAASLAGAWEPAALKRRGPKGAGDGLGYGFGAGHGDGSGQGFFTVAAGAKKLIYVLDCSGSMTEQREDGKKRLDRVKFELVRSVAALPEDAQFFIIFFNNFAIPMKAPGLQRATLDNKRKYLKWAVERQGGGGTDPVESVRQALELRPDMIYLLTDGRIGRNVPDDVTRLNRGRVAIHTICLGDRDGERGLKEIAERNGGTFLFAP